MKNSELTMNEAVAALRQGKLLIYPTETFYALGCDALNAEAVHKVYAAKKRSQNLPLPVIIGDRTHIDLIARQISSLAEYLMRVFWPGPLTILLHSADGVPELLTAGTGKVAVRCSSHPAATALCLQSAKALVSSSANLSGQPPVARAEALDSLFLARVAELAPGNNCLFKTDASMPPQGGLPSTIVEEQEMCGKRILQVLRQGAISLEELQAKIPPGVTLKAM